MLPRIVGGAKEATAKVGDVLAGRYELRELLGAGGLGRVFLASDRERRRSVAVKVFDVAPPSPEAFRRYTDAVRGASAARHAALVVPEVPAGAGGPRLAVAEALKGVDLDGLRARGDALHWPRAAEIASTCADALATIHQTTGLAHRALKPGNVWITETSQVRVLDFGVAELGITPPPARSGGLFVEYRAPEQIEGGPGDARSDVFTLAVLLFELATGVHAFSGPSAFKAAHRALQSALAVDAHGLPAQARPLLARATARRPEERFADAREFLRALTIVRQAVGSAAPRAAARSSEANQAAKEVALASPEPPAADLTTHLRIPVLRVPTPVIAPTGPRTPAEDVRPADDPPLLGAGAEQPGPARQPARPPVAEPLPALGDTARTGLLAMPITQESTERLLPTTGEARGASLPPHETTERIPPVGKGSTVVATERPRDQAPAEPTLALPEVSRDPPMSARTGDRFTPDEDAATTAMPMLGVAPRAAEAGASNPEEMSRGPSQRPAPVLPKADTTLALPATGPRAAESTLALGGPEAMSHGSSHRPELAPPKADTTLALPASGPRAAEATLALGDSPDMSHGTSHRSGPVASDEDRTLALPTTGRRAAEGTLVLDRPDGMSEKPGPRSDQETRALPRHDARAERSPEEATQALPRLGAWPGRAATVQPAPNVATSERPAPATGDGAISPRALIALNVVLGAVILASLVILVTR